MHVVEASLLWRELNEKCKTLKQAINKRLKKSHPTENILYVKYIAVSYARVWEEGKSCGIFYNMNFIPYKQTHAFSAKSHNPLFISLIFSGLKWNAGK